MTAAMTDVVLDLADEAATARLGRRLAAVARPGDVIGLEGPLGSGKTTLARAFIRALTDDAEEVPSPTFTLVQTYETPRGLIWHFDLYRLQRAEEVIELGIDEAFADGICLVEWPDRLGAWLPARRLTVSLSEGRRAGGRRVRLSGDDSWSNRLAEVTG
jgi:tRNA threonylcarbamoyladenosine biosynthesis protein TsaE